MLMSKRILLGAVYDVDIVANCNCKTLPKP